MLVAREVAAFVRDRQDFDRVVPGSIGRAANTSSNTRQCGLMLDSAPRVSL
ncbi:hypothetical protein [Gemmatimonas sp.]|uniref:hypothetical protein n=1 Tax=Gemmatimonas sp. TaxID=1962908 RepID=UPI003561D858